MEKVLTTPAAALDGVRRGVSLLLRHAGVRPAEIMTHKIPVIVSCVTRP